jgi:hypothetical protein
MSEKDHMKSVAASDSRGQSRDTKVQAIPLEFLSLRGVRVVRDKKDVVLEPHQVLPARYMASNPSNMIVCLDYDPGTGKTMTAGYILKQLLEQIQEIRRTIDRLGVSARSSGTFSATRPPKPYVIGPWSSLQAFERDLLHPMFGIVHKDEYYTLTQMVGDTQENMRKKLVTRIRNTVRLVSYQKFFNHFFRGSTSLTDKSEEAIKAALDKGDIYLDPNIVADLQHSIMIVDEFQNLYSSAGPNTYGICIEYILQLKEIVDLRLVAMSGTFIGSSIAEVVYMFNILREKGSPRLNVSDFVEQTVVNETQTVSRFAPRCGAGVSLKLEHRSREEKKYTPTPTDYFIGLAKDIVLSYDQPRNDHYPTESFEVAKSDSGKDHKLALRVYRCPASPRQWKEYTSVKEKVGSFEAGDEDTVKREYICTEFVEPSERKEGVFSPSMNDADLMTGSIFKLEKGGLQEYAAIAYAFFNAIIESMRKDRREKFVGFHRRIRHFGLKQYMEIARINGIIGPNDPVTDITRCIHCSRAKKEHKKTEKHEFVPARFCYITGALSPNIRYQILRQYNSPENVYGDKFLIVFVSSIAEIGITLLNTNNLFCLCALPNMSTLRQLTRRISRYDSHKLLPADRRWVKVHIMVLAPPPGVGGISDMEKRYEAKEKNDEEIQKYWMEQRKHCSMCEYLTPDRCVSESVRFDIAKPSRFTHDIFYMNVEIDAVERNILWRLEHDRPALTFGDISELLNEEGYSAASVSTKWVLPESVMVAIWKLSNEGKINLWTKDGQPVDIDRTTLSNKDMYITLTIDGSPIFNMIHRQIPPSTLARIPLTEGVRDPYDRKVFSNLSGNKSRLDYFNAMMAYKDFIKHIYEEMSDEDSPIFKLLVDRNAVVYEGDMDSHIKYCRNRLLTSGQERGKNPSVIGFLLGNRVYLKSTDGKSGWSDTNIQQKVVPSDNEDKHVGVFTPGNAPTPGRWFPRFLLREKMEKKHDAREQRIGLACRSIEREKLAELFSLIAEGEKTEKKEDMCDIIERVMIAKQLKSDKRIIYTPFERAVVSTAVVASPPQGEGTQ